MAHGPRELIDFVWKSIMQDIIFKFIIIPVFAILGIYIVGELISELFGVPEAAKILFWAIGGIGFFAFYFKSIIDEL
jgi:hypothetical protein